jgi:excisionase family DNA binding protein
MLRPDASSSTREGLPMKTRERLLSVPEFSESLRVTPACIRRWLLERKIAHVKIGRLVRIPESEADRILGEGLRPARRASGE